MTQKEYNVYELKLSMDKVQSHCTYYICKDSASYLPSLTTNPVTEGWVQFHYVHPASKSSDLTEGKEEKGPMQRGLKTPRWQRDRGGASPEAYAEYMTDYIAKGLAEMLQPYSKNLSGNGPAVCVALNIKLWSGRRWLLSVAGRLWEELHCNQSSFSSFYTPM